MRKQSYTIKADKDVLDKGRRKAKKQNRSFNNYIETAIMTANTLDPDNEFSPHESDEPRFIKDANRT